MDKTDLDILKLLFNDSRMAHSQIASALGESSSKIKSQLKKLQDLEIIDKYCIQVDPQALDIKKMVLLIISVEKMKSSGEDDVSVKNEQFLENVIENLIDKLKEIMVAFHSEKKIFMVGLFMDDSHLNQILKKLHDNPFIKKVEKIELKMDSYNNERILDLSEFKDILLKKQEK